MSNEEQLEYWNGEAGERWAKDDATMERLLRPVTEALLDHARIKDSTSALDVGCGVGQPEHSAGPEPRSGRQSAGCRHLGAHAQGCRRQDRAPAR